MPRNVTGKVPLSCRRRAEEPFSKAVRLSYQPISSCCAVEAQRTVDLSARGYGRIVGQDLGDVGVCAVNIVIFLRALSVIDAIVGRCEAHTCEDRVQPVEHLVGYGSHDGRRMEPKLEDSRALIVYAWSDSNDASST